MIEKLMMCVAGLVALFIVLPVLVYSVIKLGTCGYYRGRELSQRREQTNGD